jgi:hypothetical protein
LRGECNRLGGECIVRQPPARGFGEWRGESVSVLLIESMGMGDKGVEVKGRELLRGKR